MSKFVGVMFENRVYVVRFQGDSQMIPPRNEFKVLQQCEMLIDLDSNQLIKCRMTRVDNDISQQFEMGILTKYMFKNIKPISIEELELIEPRFINFNNRV